MSIETKIPNKHIITGGCSFTNCGKSWPYHINQSKHGWVHNIGTPGAGNQYISRSVIYQVDRMLNEGTNPSDISVLVMWSGVDRYEVLSTERETPMHKLYISGNDMNWLENFVGRENEYKIPFEESCWLKSSTRGMEWENKPVVKLFDNYFKNFYTEEESFIRTLESILRLQWYLNSKNIRYRLMSWQNIFNKYSFRVPKGYANENANLTGHDIWCMGWNYNQYHDNIKFPKEITQKISKDSKLLKDIYPNTTHLWDMVDFSKWWFYEDDQIEYGGLAEWIILGKRQPFGNGYEDPGHPSELSHEEFVDKVIEPILESF